MKTECIDPEIQKRYFEEYGKSVTFTKTSNRSTVTKLNFLCNRVSYLEEELTTDYLMQYHLLLSLNDECIVGNRDAERQGVYKYIDTEFAGNLSRFFGIAPYKCMAAEFEVELELETTCKRRIIVPLSYTFEQFHYLLQCLFNWQGYHLHDFMIEFYPDGRPKYTLVGFPREDELPGEVIRSDREVRLSEIFPAYDHIIYNYDFGDDWDHHIRLLQIIDEYDSKHAVCLGGEGEAPPEDVGGSGGFSYLLSVLANPDSPDYPHLKAWYDGMQCLPFNVERINKRLLHAVRWRARF